MIKEELFRTGGRLEGLHPWNKLDWAVINATVRRTQRRIYKLSRLDLINGNKNNKGRVVWLQRRLVNSLEARLYAVRMVTTENKGKNTPGVDRVLVRTPEAKLELAESLTLDGTANYVRRIWIDKPGKAEKRPLGIPTVRDRAKQALAKMALEPEWEARFEPNSYGFRPGRRTQDATEAIFQCLCHDKPKYILDADIRKCFDTISHEALLKKLDTYPEMAKQVRAWLKAGIMDEIADRQDYAPEENPKGTPQGGVISPLLANIALHGLENHIDTYVRKILSPQTPSKLAQATSLIRYADDFIVITNEMETLLILKEEIKSWLEPMGLHLSEEKTKIKISTEGVDFLGFNFMNVFASGRGKLITKVSPSNKNIDGLIKKVRLTLEKNKAASAFILIKQLKAIIIGWGNYYCTIEHSRLFKKLDNTIYGQLRAWTFRRAPKKSKTEIKAKYFPEGKTYNFRGKEHQDNWTLYDKTKVTKGWGEPETKEIFLPKLAWIPRTNHIKIEGSRSPYDGDHVYWGIRQNKYSGLNRTERTLLTKQRGYCPHCKAKFTMDDMGKMETDHIIPTSQGGPDKISNKQLLHKICHAQKTAADNQHFKISLPSEN